MGYDIVDGQLVVNETDATTIGRILALYLEEGNVPALLERLPQEVVRARYLPKRFDRGDHRRARWH